MNEKTISIIEKLIAVCKDGAESLELAASEANSSVVQSLFRGYSLQRLRFSGDLQTAASALGKSLPAEEGSASGAVSRTWMKATDATARDEQAVISECERGEDAAEAAYTLALEEPELPSGVRALIAAQAMEVKGAHNEVRNLRNRYLPAAQT